MSDDKPAEWAEEAWREARKVRREYHGDSGRPRGKPLVHIRCAVCGKRAATIEVPPGGGLVVLDQLSRERFTYPPPLGERGFAFRCPEHGLLDVSFYAVMVWTTDARNQDTPATKKAAPRDTPPAGR